MLNKKLKVQVNLLDRLTSFVGLVPSLHSSGEKSYSRGITYRSKNLQEAIELAPGLLQKKTQNSCSIISREKDAITERSLSRWLRRHSAGFIM